MMQAQIRRGRQGFWLKAAMAAALVAGADWLFFVDEIPGSTVGAFALAWMLAVVVAHPALRRDRRALGAVALAAGFALVLVDHPTPLSWILFWISLASAALLPRVAKVTDAWRWSLRLIFFAVAGALRPALDVIRLNRTMKSGPRRSVLHWIQLLIVPLLGGGMFLFLFAVANPLIEQVVTHLQLGRFDPWRLMFWLATLAMVWAALRPSLRRRLKPLASATSRKPIALPLSSITLSLIVFNALFAIENGLDIAFLWSGAGLPEGVTLAQYAHRGAYPLIATAILAGLFVLVALAPGSDSARRPLVRQLVLAWVAQNIFLVASSMLRTADYIEAYSLTRFRIAALIWMALVALGLVLICWRLLRGKSAAWLINTNVIAALMVLSTASVVDLGAIAAAWNVRHARELSGRGAALDYFYLQQLGSSSLGALIDLEQGSIGPELRGKAITERILLIEHLERKQADWRRWTLRDAVRLDDARRRLATPALTSTSRT